jgi:predicted nucleic acid-binding protein
MKYVLDTNIFNKLVDGSLVIDELPSDGQMVATHIQIDELNNTNDRERRAKLFLRFAEIAPEMLPTESIVFDVSRFDHAKFSDGKLFKSLKYDLDVMNGGKANNTHDALIAEVAIVNSYTLITSDFHLAEVAKKHGAKIIYYHCCPVNPGIELVD